jgi:hypothetical protein
VFVNASCAPAALAALVVLDVRWRSIVVKEERQRSFAPAVLAALVLPDVEWRCAVVCCAAPSLACRCLFLLSAMASSCLACWTHSSHHAPAALQAARQNGRREHSKRLCCCSCCPRRAATAEWMQGAAAQRIGQTVRGAIASQSLSACSTLSQPATNINVAWMQAQIHPLHWQLSQVPSRVCVLCRAGWQAQSVHSFQSAGQLSARTV